MMGSVVGSIRCESGGQSINDNARLFFLFNLFCISLIRESTDNSM